MSNECTDKDCSQHFHSHSKEHCTCCCHQGCACSCHKKQKYTDQLFKLADEAWMEVLKEKIKDEIRQKAGDHLSQLAQLTANSNQKRWKDELDEKKNLEEFDASLKNLMYRHQQKESGK
jgi:hypothetical protein